MNSELGPAGRQAAQLHHVIMLQTWSFLLLVVCFPPQMVSSALLMLLALPFEFGQSSHKHQDDDHYIGQQHNPEHDMNVLFGDEVYKTELKIPTRVFSPLLYSFYSIAGH